MGRRLARLFASLIALGLVVLGWQEPAIAQADSLVGYWVGSANDYIYFTDDGRFEYRDSEGNLGYGEYRDTGVLLKLEDRANGFELAFRPEIYVNNGHRRLQLKLDRLDLEPDSGPPTILIYWERAGSPPSIAGRAGAPIGSWVSSSGILKIEKVFSPDGRYKYRTAFGDEKHGTYEVSGQSLIIVTADGNTETLEWKTDREFNRRRLLIRDSMGEWITMYEKQAP